MSDWWARQDLNLGPMDYESTALTAELRARVVLTVSFYTSIEMIEHNRLLVGVNYV